MSHTITVQPSGRTYAVEDGERILTAAIRQGIGLPYSCRDGTCGTCKVKKLSGTVTHVPHQEKALSRDEQAQGWILTCSSFADTDVVLESTQVTEEGAIPIRRMPARVAALNRLADDVMQVRLQLPTSEKVLYHPGQYMEVILRGGAHRDYSVACAPHRVRESGAPMIELHIRHTPGGQFTDHVFAAMKEKEILRLEGPYGSSYLRDDSDKPIVLLASGTGFAPIKAIIEHLQFMQSPRKAVLYWGGRRPPDLYMGAWVRQRLAEMPQLSYVPVVSDALPEDGWSGRTGFVHLAVLQDFPDLSGHQVYACGAPVVVDSAKRDFVERAGLPVDEFFADAFTTEADKVHA